MFKNINNYKWKIIKSKLFFDIHLNLQLYLIIILFLLNMILFDVFS
jgi:hypothetical protein